MKRVLHALSQRPLRTGSGVTLDALARHATARGWTQHAIVGVPADDPTPSFGGLPPEVVHPFVFDIPVPGMSDVMPYPSTVFSTLDDAALAKYENNWVDHVRRVLDVAKPDLVHTNHAWILSAVVCDLANVPVVLHGHATGLRQMTLCRPEVGERVRRSVKKASAFVVLHEEHRRKMIDTLGVDPSVVHTIGAGYREEIFVRDGREPKRRVVYAGKLAKAKGVEPLLDAMARLDAELHIAGDGDERIRERVKAEPNVVWHGMLSPEDLAALLKTASVFVLPSFYEGLPLVIVEALACGCRVVATALEGVEAAIRPHTGDALETVALPRLIGADRPVPEDLPAFVDRLEAALRAALDAPEPEPLDLSSFTWRAVFDRVERVWRAIDSGEP